MHRSTCEGIFGACHHPTLVQPICYCHHGHYCHHCVVLVISLFLFSCFLPFSWESWWVMIEPSVKWLCEACTVDTQWKAARFVLCLIKQICLYKYIRRYKYISYRWKNILQPTALKKRISEWISMGLVQSDPNIWIWPKGFNLDQSLALTNWESF